MVLDISVYIPRKGHVSSDGNARVGQVVRVVYLFGGFRICGLHPCACLSNGPRHVNAHHHVLPIPHDHEPDVSLIDIALDAHIGRALILLCVVPKHYRNVQFREIPCGYAKPEGVYACFFLLCQCLVREGRQYVRGVYHASAAKGDGLAACREVKLLRGKTDKCPVKVLGHDEPVARVGRGRVERAVKVVHPVRGALSRIRRLISRV